MTSLLSFEFFFVMVFIRSSSMFNDAVLTDVPTTA